MDADEAMSTTLQEGGYPSQEALDAFFNWGTDRHVCGVRMLKPVIYCPKCNSENVGVVCLNPPKPKRHSIDELPLRRRVVRTVGRNLWWRATCANCSYSKEYIDTPDVM